MPITRRAALATGAGLLAAPSLGRAQEQWPNRTIRLIVPFTPAGTTDIAARIIAERLTQRLGQSVIVENRPGAGGNVGSDVVVKSDPDGYTLLMCTVSSGAINYSLYGAKMPYKPDALAACGLMLQVPNAIFVTNALPVKTLKELVDYVKARPGQLNNGSSGIGTSLHLTGELLKSVTGIQMQHVPFRGAGPMIQEVIAGRIEVAVDNLPSIIGHIRDGRVRALAVTTAQRSPALPDVPTTAEAGFPDVQATAWFGIQVPARTPKPIIDRLGTEIDAIVKEPETRAKIADLGGMAPGLTPDGGTSPATFEAFITAEIAKWTEVVRKSGATAE
ncbi:tripartite tricarboxylate transporter substrate binding protein [Belnapia sp. T6]|uniref:Tripartite tricarboxylate transporter substrate binding protein n=1 Tax=Belnapia mucosa TaxID=2804532 RepID=A0ABS1UZC8_9PROT|nr:tripartite tricarboxylate transporter substrate binding protein [Belnapia mucosa]MBL6454372.1 tripartite tricarboxylate transporter substrate binding protein [Belnapia mucosa]